MPDTAVKLNNPNPTAPDKPVQKTPLQLMEEAAAQVEAEQAAELARQRAAYLKSPQGKLEQAMLKALPDYRPAKIDEQELRGGFYGNSFEVEGVPATLMIKFWPRDQLHEAREIWKPVLPEMVTQYEAGLNEGLMFVRRGYEVVDRLVCTGKSTNDQVMLYCSRDAYDVKAATKTANWNARFKRAAPEGQVKARMESGVQGRQFEIDSENYSQAEISRTVLQMPGEGDVDA